MVRIAQSWGDAANVAGVFIARGQLSTPLTHFPGLEALQRGAIDLDEYLEGLRDFLATATLDEALRVHLAILLGPYAGTLELVREMEATGVVTACLSNTNEPHWEVMSESGRFPNIARLQFAALSHRLRLEKPQPEIYRELERMVGAAGEEVAFFDDSPVNVQAARALGWNADTIDPAADPAAQIRRSLAQWGLNTR